MMLSELIFKLQNSGAKYGDVPVRYSAQYSDYSDGIEFVTYDDASERIIIHGY